MPTRSPKKYKLHSKTDALNLAGRYFKLFTDKVEASGPGGGPMAHTHTTLTHDELHAELVKRGLPTTIFGD